MSYPPHRARHPLPVSYGFSGTDEICVICGRCGNEAFRADREWAIRYLDATARRLAHHLYDPPPYRITEEKATEILAEYVAQFRRAGLVTADDLETLGVGVL